MDSRAKQDVTDSKIQTKVTFIATTSSITSEEQEEGVVDEEEIGAVQALNTEALHPQQRFALAETLSRCLPARNSAIGRTITTVVIIVIIILLEVIVASDYKTLKVLSQSIIDTLTSNETVASNRREWVE
jgi:hypothetical protein